MGSILRITVFIITFLFSLPLTGQINTYTTTGKSRILAGDYYDITITVDRDDEVQLDGAAIEHIRQLDWIKVIDFSEGADSIKSGAVSRTYRLRIALYEEGIVSVPGIRIQYNYRNSTAEIFSDSVQVEVRLLPESNTILPIKDIIKEELRWYDSFPFLWFGIGLVVLAAVLWFFFRKKKVRQPAAPAEPEPIQRHAHEIALEELSALAGKELWQNERIKEYQSELTDIIRFYLKRRFGINAPEMTTSETLRALKPVISSAQLRDVNDVLNVADMIKFAKHQPDQSVHEIFFDKAKDFVIQTAKNRPRL